MPPQDVLIVSQILSITSDLVPFHFIAFWSYRSGSLPHRGSLSHELEFAMESLEKETGSQQPSIPFPELGHPFEDGSLDSKPSVPELQEPAGHGNPSRPRKRTLRKAVETTKSALRRRTISNPGFRPPIGRRLRFAAHDAGHDHGGSTEQDKRGQSDDFREQLEHQLPARLSFKQRMRHFTWTWFTMTMATGGIANVL